MVQNIYVVFAAPIVAIVIFMSFDNWRICTEGISRSVQKNSRSFRRNDTPQAQLVLDAPGFAARAVAVAHIEVGANLSANGPARIEGRHHAAIGGEGTAE